VDRRAEVPWLVRVSSSPAGEQGRQRSLAHGFIGHQADDIRAARPSVMAGRRFGTMSFATAHAAALTPGPVVVRPHRVRSPGGIALAAQGVRQPCRPIGPSWLVRSQDLVGRIAVFRRPRFGCTAEGAPAARGRTGPDHGDGARRATRAGSSSRAPRRRGVGTAGQRSGRRLTSQTQRRNFLSVAKLTYSVRAGRRHPHASRR
jgi:hypothetical protein